MTNKEMQMMAMQLHKQQMLEQNDALIGDALNQVATENIMLKNTIESMKLKTSKQNLINQGRTKPVDLSKRRSGKRKGGTI
tara:strand:- start:3259 stop:3501 length:243 start_codon:yes stop_codon:yes gene_type:complete